MEERMKYLILIAINNVKTANTKEYCTALSTAKIILEHVEYNLPELKNTIRSVISFIEMAKMGYEIRINVIKKLEDLYSKM